MKKTIISILSTIAILAIAISFSGCSAHTEVLTDYAIKA